MSEETDRLVKTARQPVVLLLSALLIFAVLFSSVAAFVIWRVTQALDETRCIVKVQGEFMNGVGHAFDTPPAPNAQRTRAVAEIKAASKKLDNIDHVC